MFYFHSNLHSKLYHNYLDNHNHFITYLDNRLYCRYLFQFRCHCKVSHLIAVRGQCMTYFLIYNLSHKKLYIQTTHSILSIAHQLQHILSQAITIDIYCVKIEKRYNGLFKLVCQVLQIGLFALTGY